MDEYRESIWGISPRDRKWFQFITLLGGTTGSIVLTLLEFDSLSASSVVSEAARNIALGIGASFVASGFIAWGLIHARENIVTLADWIRDATRRRRERWMAEGRKEGREEGREEGYDLGYSDAAEGRPHRRPGDENTNGTAEDRAVE